MGLYDNRYPPYTIQDGPYSEDSGAGSTIGALVSYPSPSHDTVMSFFSEDVKTGDNGSYRSSSDASSGSAPSAHGIDLGPAGHVVGIASMFSDAYSQIDSTGQISNVEQEFPSRLNEYSNFPTHQFDVSSTQDFEDRYAPLLIEYDNVADRAGYDISFFIEDYDQLSRRHVGVGADTQPRGVNPNDEASASLHEYCSSNHELGGILERSAAEHASTQTSCIGQVNTSFSSDRCTRKDRRSPSPWSPYLVANAMPLPARAHVNAGFAVGNMSIGSIRGSDLDSDWSMMSFDDRTTTSGLLSSPQFETDDSVATVSRSSIEGSWSEIHSSPAKEQYLQYPNGSLSAESYYGMPIDCTRSWNGTHTTTLLR